MKKNIRYSTLEAIDDRLKSLEIKHATETQSLKEEREMIKEIEALRWVVIMPIGDDHMLLAVTMIKSACKIAIMHACKRINALIASRAVAAFMCAINSCAPHGAQQPFLVIVVVLVRMQGPAQAAVDRQRPDGQGGC